MTEETRIVEDTLITSSSGNVFADLGLEDADELLAKAELAFTLKQTIKQRGITQKRAAEMMGESEANVSRIVNMKLDAFSIERLQKHLIALGKVLELTIRDADDIEKPGRMVIRSA